MRCRDQRRIDLHSSQISALQEHLETTKTPRPLAAAISKGLEGWHYNPNYQIPIPRYDRTNPNIVLRQALQNQNAIGWGRMYSGQISQDFQTVHNADRPRGTHDRNANASTLSDWASKLITLLFDHFEEQWKLRNEALHGRDAAEHLLFHRAKLSRRVTRIYDQIDLLLANDREILARPLQTILDLPISSLEAWVYQVEPTIRRCISDANAAHVQTNTIDTHFLRRRRDG
jgi:hypothetical protein